MPFTILQQEAPGGVRLGNMVNYASRGLYSAKSNSIWNTHHFAIARIKLFYSDRC